MTVSWLFNGTQNVIILKRDPAYHWSSFDLSPPGQNVHHFADNIFKCIFVNEKFCILIWISLYFVPKDTIYNQSALDHVMARPLTGNKPLPEPKLNQLTDTYMQHEGRLVNCYWFKLNDDRCHSTASVTICSWLCCFSGDFVCTITNTDVNAFYLIWHAVLLCHNLKQKQTKSKEIEHQAVRFSNHNVTHNPMQIFTKENFMKIINWKET